MDLFGIGSMFGAIGDAVVGGLNYAEQKNQNKIDNAYRDKAFEYQKELQQQIFQREDNAVQRRVADLEKAGFNKLMASGQSANAGQAVGAYSGAGGQAPQMQLGIQQSIDSIYNAIKMNNDISMSEAQKKLIEQEIISKQIASDLDIANTKSIDAKTKEILYNYNKSRNMNLRTTDSVDVKYNTAKAAMSEVTKAAAETVQDAQKSMERNQKAKKQYETTGGKTGRRYGYGAGTEYY